MSFRLRFWGTRGSIPTPGSATVRYGGNTPSIEVRTPSGSLVVLDAGTGIRELGRALIARANGSPITGDIFLTHAHWDHIQGIPFFAPAFQRGNRFTIWGAKSLAASIRQRFGAEASARDGQVRVEISNGHRFIAEVVEAFPGAVDSVGLHKPSLEDVFVRETGASIE